MLPTSEPAPLSPSTELPDPFFNLVKSFARAPAAADWSGLVLLIIIVAVSGSGVLGAGALLAAVALRDLVRLAAMKAVDAYDSRLLLFPFVKGELPIGTTPGREAVIILSGPAFLVALSTVSYFVAKVTGPGIIEALSQTSVGLAAFTLLPLKPYDGWRLLNLALFSRSAKFEMAVAVLTSLVLAGLSIALSAWFLTFFALLNLVTAPRVLKVGRAADQLGNVALSGNTGTLPEPELRALYDATVAHFGDGFGPKQEPQAKLCATLMREVHLRAARPIPSIGVSLVLVTVYVALIVYFLVGLVLLFANTQPASA